MPRPTISGNVIRRIDMNHTSSGKDKDYRITIAQEADGTCRVYTEYGPAGKLQNGKEQTKNPVSVGQAELMADNIRDGKIQQSDSYDVMSDRRFSPSAAGAATAPAPVATPAPTPARQLVSAESLSPASRAALAAIF